MISKRLLSITKFINKKDKIVDVGCDHGLLSIYLYENELCSNVIASDVNKNALQNAINNIKNKKYDIETVLSDGIKKIDMSKVDTIVISGMGTSTIINILSDQDKLVNVKKIILQSNNEHTKLREYLNNIGYYLKDEDVVYDSNKYYVTMSFIKDNQKNNKKEIKYGIAKKKNKLYYDYLITSYYKILNKIPKKRIFERHKYHKLIKDIKNLI